MYKKAARWYDKDPTVSLAVSILRSTSTENQKIVADFMLKKLQDSGVEIITATKPKFLFLGRRWYDDIEVLQKAMESMKNASLEIQKELSLEMINYLCELDNSVSSDITK